MEFLCLDFVNSSWYITHKPFSDPLRDNGWFGRLAGKYDMELPPAPKADELEELLELRSFLSQVFDKLITGITLEESDIKLVNNYMRPARFHRELKCTGGACSLQDVPEILNWDWFMAEVAASFSRLLSSELVNCLKVCQNPDCKWLFIDKSKSRNRKWCDDTCATLMKVRRFRQREKNTH